MSFFTTDATKTVTITGTDGETAEVTLRYLSIGDLQNIEDEDESLKGSIKLLERVIVSWSLPSAPTYQSISALTPKVFRELSEAVAEMNALSENPLDESS